MAIENLTARLNKTNIPYAYRAFPEGTTTPPPFICYFSTGADNLIADGGVYYSAIPIRLELYTQDKSVETERAVEATLQGYAWSKDETYIDSERCYLIIYEFEV